MRSLFIMVLSAILCTITVDALADENWYFARDKEVLFGTWINLDYSYQPPQKLVYNSDGTAWSATNADADLPDWRLRYLITGRWKDSNGNIMYKIHFVGSWGESGYSLCRISNSGKTLEYMNNHLEYPKEVDPNKSYYRKYQRK